MNKHILTAATLIVFIALSLSQAHAWSKLLHGKPTIVPGKDQGVFFWVEEDTFHIRFTSPESKSEFWGVIDTQNPVEITKTYGIAQTDILRKDGDKQIRLKIDTKAKQIKGFDFKTDSNTLAFTMNINGVRVAKINFRGGKDKVPFEHTPFKVFNIDPDYEGPPPLKDPKFQ